LQLTYLVFTTNNIFKLLKRNCVPEMKRIVFLFLIVLSVYFNALNGQTIHCLWEPKPVNIDGKPEEWPEIFNYYDGNTKLQFAFASDTGNMYVALKITDDQTQMRLFNGGLGVWIDPKGKRKETMGVSFPLKGDRVQGSGENGKHKKQGSLEDIDPRAVKSDALRLKQNAFLTQTTLRVKGFAGLPEQVLPLKNDFGINVGFNWDSLNTLTIEYRFPLQLVLGHPFTATDTLKPISVAFIEPSVESPKLENREEDNTITGPSNQNNMNRGIGASPYGGMNNGMGGMGRNSMGAGGGNHAPMQQLDPAKQEQKLWSKVILTLE
jgi:hypothetical protein